MVATLLLSIVMAAVYTAFSSALRVWRIGEANLNAQQEVRTTMSVMSHELNCVLSGTNHMFKGKKNEFEFYAVTPPMDVVKSGEGPRVMWVRYSFNRSGHRLERHEAIVESPVPPEPPPGEEPDTKHLKLGRKKKFDLASKIHGFDVTYIWVPEEKDVNEDDPPQYIEPIEMDHNEPGWGLPQAMKISLTLEDPTAVSKRSTFTTMIVFRCQTTKYDDKKLGATGEFQ